MEEKLDRYELLIDDEYSMGAISFVNEPANESQYLAFDATKINMSSMVEDKQEVIGVVLIPEQDIFRVDQSGYKYTTFMSKETIQGLSVQYLKNMWGTASTTLQHELKVNDTTLMESWITGKNDKAKELGFDVPEGSWCVHFKVNSDTVWGEIKAGMANGFSIEAWLNLLPTELSKQKEIDLTDEELENQIRELFETNK